MSTIGITGPSPRKPRGRPVSDDTIALRDTLGTILAEQHPMTARGAFYAASVRGAVDKTEQGCRKVQRLLVKMREDFIIPWSWIVDGTRWRRGPETFSDVEDALQRTAALYRRNLWDHAPLTVEVWLEKDALSGVLLPITDKWTVDLMVCRGYPSLSYLHAAAEHARAVDKPLQIYYLGDHDPSGKDIPRTIRKRLTEFGADFDLTELAVTTEQIEAWQLPSRPTKKTDSRASGFVGDSVELDAIPPALLRDLVDNAISPHIDRHQLEVLQAYEAEERALLYDLAGEAA